MEFGLIGEHISHSYSKNIHESLSHYPYEICDINESELSYLLKARKFKGLNVTIPYKEKVIEYLDYIDDCAKAMHSVNTIVNKNGKLYGYNTDMYGVIETFNHFNVNVSGKNVVILGTGGASKMLVYTLNKLGAKQITTISRTNNGTDIYTNIYKYYENTDILINATPNGMYKRECTDLVDLSKFKNLVLVFDLIYNPLNTKLLVDARKLGIKAINGMYMLIAQAIKAMEYFRGEKVSKDKVDAYFNKLTKEKLNLVLIGMPTSGKSTIGKTLSTKLNKEFIDIDSYIENKYGISIGDYIREKGEKAFREIETMSIKEIKDYSSSIISTGGGVVLNEENIDYLRQNGIIIFINRSLDKLFPSSDRPLSSDKLSLETKYNERIDLYKKYADYIIDNNKNIDDSTYDIVRLYNEIICD